MYRNYYSKRPKYNSRRTTVDGITFDSLKEAKRYVVLKTLQEEGRISHLQRQVKYTLIPAQYDKPHIDSKGRRKQGKLLERAVSYVADFVYIDEHGRQVVEDVKGIRTPEYKIKRKLMLYLLNIRIKET